MRNSKTKKALSLLLSLILALSTLTVAAGAAGFTAPDYMYLISDTQSVIAPGVVENKVITNDASGQNQVMGYAVSVDMSEGSTASLMAGYADYSGAAWKMQTVRNQAAALEKATGANVVAGFNADIFNMSTGEPTGGPLVMNGTVYKAALGQCYFGITTDGKAVIGERLTQSVLDTLKEAVGGFFVVVKNGQRYGSGWSKDNQVPRTAVGIKADGTVVVYTADGRNYPQSCGLSIYDLTSIMMGFGCVDVLNLDGGGSATYLAKYEGSAYLEVVNKPSDGIERKVSSSLFIVSSAKPTGVFDHASLSPNNEIYTPGTTVDFSVLGVDSSGAAAPLPADGTFALDSGSAQLGTITSDGKFTSNGTTGSLTVNYISAGAVCGSTTVEIAHPDEIYFASSEVSLGFGDVSDLGLNVKYRDRDVNYKAGDFSWSTTHDAISENDKFEYQGKNVIYSGSQLYYLDEEAIGAALSEAETADFYNTILGTFDGNTFTSSPGNSINGTVTASYVNNSAVSASLRVIIGRLPSVAEDFESDIVFGRVAFNANGGIQKWETTDTDIQNSCNLLTGHYLNGDGTSRGGNESAEIVDVDSGEPVRFGNQSLKLNYDFTNINGIEGACVGFTEQSQPIEGNPTGIGMWVYVPEGTPNFWLRIRLLDGNDNILTLNFTAQKEGINWNGWKYVECDLTEKQGPFKLMGGETIRLMHTYSAYDGMGDWLAGTVTTAGPDENSVALDRATCKGSIYVDNLQFVYGANVDDIDNPVVDTIKANGEEISDSTVLTTETVDFQTYFHDVENKYTSGIDYDVVRIYVDGVNRSYDSSCVLTQGDNRLDLYGLKLADGEHTVMILLRDKFGNETTQTRTFKVDTSGASGLTNVGVSPVSVPVLGHSFSLKLDSNNASAVKTVDTVIKVGTDFNSFAVNFGADFSGSHSYNAATGEISINAQRTGSTAGGAIAELVFDIPSNTAQGTKFTYSVPYGSFTLNSAAAENTANTFALSTQRLDISAPINISLSPVVVGLPAVISVKDANGNAMGGVDLFFADGTKLGITAADGTLTTNAFSASASAFSIYAGSSGDVSYIVNFQSVAPAGNSDGTPSTVTLNASQNSALEKNITWISNPVKSADSAVAQYALKSDYESAGEAAFAAAAGTTEIRQLLGSADINNNYAVRINTVVLDSLKPDSEYVYRVGDGVNFSSISEFKTSFSGEAVNFFVVGDTQAADTTNISNIINSLASDSTKYSFGVQTGDFVEKPTLWADWEAILDVFGKDYMRTVDMIHVIGNHEQFGDDMNNLFVKSLFNVSEPTHYSAEYGNVYVAVINYTGSEEQLAAEMEWMIADAAQSDCQWKIMVSHQPPYGTNDAATDTGLFNKLVPAACEQAGIDFVFSGHDHALARTLPMTAGEVDEENGVVYYVCGSTGEKSYTATNKPEYNFEFVDQEYTAVYLTVEATDEYMNVVVRESDGSVVDSYKKTSDESCSTAGHSYVYTADGYLKCSECGYGVKLGAYSGFAVDEATGRTRYFLNGEAQYGWLNYVEDCYYFDENALALTGKQRIDGITYNFAADGKQIGGAFHKDSDGYTRCYRGGSYLTGWHEIDGYLYFFTSAESVEGMMFTGKRTIRLYTGQNVTYTFSSDGKLLKGSFYEHDEGTVYYWGPDPLAGWQEIDGYTYFFDPETNYMATDSVEIDGKMYAFNSDGHFAHEGAHNWSLTSTEAPSCTRDGREIYTCDVCASEKTATIGKLGHVDENSDDICERCDRYAGSDSTFISFILTFFIKLRNWFAKIFKGI